LTFGEQSPIKGKNPLITGNQPKSGEITGKNPFIRVKIEIFLTIIRFNRNYSPYFEQMSKKIPHNGKNSLYLDICQVISCSHSKWRKAMGCQAALQRQLDSYLATVSNDR
jgi:hypothetical protein